MAITNALLIANVMHARQRPRKHMFNYTVYYLCFMLSDMRAIANKILSINRFNLFSFQEKDHGVRDGSSNEAWIRAVLAEWKVPEADGEITVVTLPRIFGHVFNPVSFWYCMDKEGRLRAVLSEVTNTFGDHHNYISFHDDRRPIGSDDWLTAQKVFHVSPFMDITGHYQFRFICNDRKIGAWVNHYDDEGLMLATSVTGKRVPLTTKSLLWCFFRYPMITLKVIGLIHFQALRLWTKGIKYRPRPLPPTTEVSR